MVLRLQATGAFAKERDEAGGGMMAEGGGLVGVEVPDGGAWTTGVKTAGARMWALGMVVEAKGRDDRAAGKKAAGGKSVMGAACGGVEGIK